MNKNPFNLYPHNKKASEEIERRLNNGEDVIGILHATGTGKSFISLDIINNHPNENIIFVTRYNSIIEHIKEIIKNNPNINTDDFLKNVTFITYSSLVNMTREQIAAMNIDILITDEFHHIGAPVWENRIDFIRATHPSLKIIGLSAYSIRNRHTAYERDMAEPSGTELFSDRICSTYNLVDAMLDEILPIPRYKTALIVIDEYLLSIEKDIKTKYSKSHPMYKTYMNIIEELRKKVNLSKSMDEIIKNNIELGDKYIYFCPLDKDEDNIDKIIEETKDMFLRLGYKEEDLVFYKTTSKDSKNGKLNREAFYDDKDLQGHNVSNKIRIMFAINQYNEGVHVPNLSGVILGRGTKSDIVFFEQIGRALSINGIAKEKIEYYKSKSRSELEQICQNKGIKFNDKMTNGDIIERIISPLIIDLAGNFTYIRDLITNIKRKLSERRTERNYNSDAKTLSISEEVFDIEIIGEDIFKILEGLKSQFSPRSFDETFALAKSFYIYYGNLNIPRSFKTNDGINYDQFGYSLGEWLAYIRSCKSRNELNEDQIMKLESIGIKWRLVKTFEESYLLAKEYYNIHHNLRIPSNYKTEDGYALGNWLAIVRQKKKKGLLSQKQISLLDSIGMEWSIIQTFTDSYNLLKRYYDYYNSIDIPQDFKTSDGINYDENGFDLSEWLNYQKTSYHKGKLSAEKIKLFEKMNIDWGEKKEQSEKLSWDDYYKLAVSYYNYYGSLKMKRTFCTFDGIHENKEGYKLGSWISRQQTYKKKHKLTSEQIDLLDKVGMVWTVYESYKTWEESFELAKKYYDYYGNLNVPTDYRTKEGYNLSSFLYQQRKKRENGQLTTEQIDKLDSIGMIWNNTENYSKIKETLKSYDINPRKYSSSVRSLSFLEFQAKLNFILKNNLPIVENNKLNSIFNMTNPAFYNLYQVNIYELIEAEKISRKS